jgi:peroxiredoxin
MIVEPFAHDELEKNLNPVGRIFYSASTMICTPASKSQEVGLALGAQAGEGACAASWKRRASSGFAARPRRRSTSCWRRSREARDPWASSRARRVRAGCAGRRPCAPRCVRGSRNDRRIVVTEAMGSPHVGDGAPDFELPDQNGKLVNLSAARGSVVVLAFVASFCPFSKAEQPYLAKLAHRLCRQEREGRRHRNLRARGRLPRVSRSHTHGPARAPRRRQARSRSASRHRARSRSSPTARRPWSPAIWCIAPDGKIRFFTVLDTVHFDPKLVQLRRALEPAPRREPGMTPQRSPRRSPLLLSVACASAAASRGRRPGIAPVSEARCDPRWDRPSPARPLLALELPDIAGSIVSLASMRGSWVLVHFTATWCPFCDSELAHLGSSWRKRSRRGRSRPWSSTSRRTRDVWSDYAAKHVDPVGRRPLRCYRREPRLRIRASAARSPRSTTGRRRSSTRRSSSTRRGAIRLFLLPDSAHFDPTFRAVRRPSSRPSSPRQRSPLALRPAPSTPAVTRKPTCN